jgi:hypothetical protein
MEGCYDWGGREERRGGNGMESTWGRECDGYITPLAPPNSTSFECLSVA